MAAAISTQYQRVYKLLYLLAACGIAVITLWQLYGDVSISNFSSFSSTNWQKRMLKSAKEEKENVTNYHILANTTKNWNFSLDGAVFNKAGVAGYVSVRLQSGLLHSFSPEIEKAARQRVLDPVGDNIYFANSPAITWYQGQLVLLLRIWLDREKYAKTKKWPVNQFDDNYLFMQSFNAHLNPLNSGSFLGIPAPKFLIGSGPIEPRVFKVGDKLFASFNIAMLLNSSYTVDITTFWDFQKNKPIIPNISGGNALLKKVKKGRVPRDKHWMPFTVKKKLYFVKNLDPLVVLLCELNGNCSMVHNEDPKNSFNFHPLNLHIRGGTPLELYRFPYYIGFAHVTLFNMDDNRYYTANLIVFCADPYRIVFVSDQIQVHPDVYEANPMVRTMYIKDNFIFPVGIILEDPDSVVLGAHVNDHSSVLFRIKGIQTLMDKIIAEDTKYSSKKGPHVNFIQKYVFQRTSNLTHSLFGKIVK